MRCEEFEDRLNAVLDERRRIEADAELAAHCATCADCRRLSAAYTDMLDGFHFLAQPDSPSDLGLRVVNQLRPRPSAVRGWSLAAASLATAAGLLVAMVPLFRPTPTDAPTASRSTVSQSTVPQTVKDSAARAALPVTSATRANLLAEFRIAPELLSLASAPDSTAYQALARETGLGLAAVAPYMPGLGVGGLAGAVANIAINEPTWAAPVIEGVKSMASVVAQSVDEMLKTAPVAGPSTQS